MFWTLDLKLVFLHKILKTNDVLSLPLGGNLHKLVFMWGQNSLWDGFNEPNTLKVKMFTTLCSKRSNT